MLAFIPYDHAHYYSMHISKKWGELIKNILDNDKRYKVYYCAIPYKPLIGIKAPAIGIELGVHNKNDVPYFVQLMAHSLEPVFNKLMNQ